MAKYGTEHGWASWRSGWAAAALAMTLLGCSQSVDVASPPETAPASTTQAAKEVSADPRFTQTFEDATRKEPPADGQRPPDKTMTEKSVGKLYTEIVQLWDTVRLTDANGRPLAYTAIVETELGSIEIALRPDVAPNHVRNFIALTKVGFYEGLVFERTVREKAEGHPDLELLEAGCPLGTGDVGSGSLGYWLKPEFNSETHEEGTVGACHGEEADTACCKFYITLSKAPFLDKNFTVFGKVTHGLDVARKVLSLPVRNDPAFPEGDRPVNPVVIRTVTLQLKDAESSVAAGPSR